MLRVSDRPRTARMGRGNLELAPPHWPVVCKSHPQIPTLDAQAGSSQLTPLLDGYRDSRAAGKLEAEGVITPTPELSFRRSSSSIRTRNIFPMSYSRFTCMGKALRLWLSHRIDDVSRTGDSSDRRLPARFWEVTDRAVHLLNDSMLNTPLPECHSHCGRTMYDFFSYVDHPPGIDTEALSTRLEFRARESIHTQSFSLGTTFRICPPYPLSRSTNPVPVP